MTPMDKTSLFIEPDDVWLFRDGRPFAAGDQSRAASIFPPTPLTIQGALRSLRLAQSGASFAQQTTWPADVGAPQNFGSLRLRGPILAKRNTNSDQLRRYFPLPADLTKFKTGWHILSPQSASDVDFNWPDNTSLLGLFPPGGGEPEKFEAGWLNEDGLHSYLSGDVDGVNVHSSTELFLPEPRMGVQIDSHIKQPTEGDLYQVEFVRLQHCVGLLLEVTGLNVAHQGLLQLGGESRAARYETVGTSIELSQAGRLNPGALPLRFKLYLATPAIFENGWLPGVIDETTLRGNWRNLDLQLVSAAIGKTQLIGGRDISQNDAQRPLRRVVPAGSVYFFEAMAGDKQPTDVMNAFDGQCVSDADAQVGFGLCYVGGW